MYVYICRPNARSSKWFSDRDIIIIYSKSFNRSGSFDFQWSLNIKSFLFPSFFFFLSSFSRLGLTKEFRRHRLPPGPRPITIELCPNSHYATGQLDSADPPRAHYILFIYIYTAVYVHVRINRTQTYTRFIDTPHRRSARPMTSHFTLGRTRFFGI